MPSPKVQQAKIHLGRLRATVDDYHSRSPYRVGIRRQPDTRRLVYYVSEILPLPADLPAIAGDVIQNLRSALDHAVYRIASRDTGKADLDHIYFPISKDADQFKKDAPGKLKGITTPAAIREVEALRPYKGGNDTLWRLHRLSIIDKHRILITVGSKFKSMNFAAVMEQKIKAAWPKEPHIKMPPLFFGLDGEPPLTVGSELFNDGPDAEPNPDIQFRFNLVFWEAGVAERLPVVETLELTLKEVERAVTILSAL